MNYITKCFYYCLGWLEYNPRGVHTQVSVHCMPGQECSSYSTMPCNSDNSVFVICGKKKVINGYMCVYWRASEASETLSGLFN